MGELQNFGRYQVQQLLGQGAMGLVYLAKDPVIGREVAIKVIEVPAGQDGPGLQARFEREFRSAGTLSHPNIVTIHDVGTEGDRTFIAMEYVRGESLEAIAASKSLPSLETVADLLDQICSGLDYAHERGIVHRDIKPANIIVTPDGRPKITDFGVAKVLDSGTVAMTQEGAAIGTPSYMAPEQAKGSPVKGTADQFSVAVIAYRLLAGECPFMGESWSTIMYKIVHEDPVALNVLNRTIPAGVSAAVMKALGKDPAQRFPTCSAFAAAVRAALAGGRVERRDRPNAAVAATVVLDGRAAAGPGRILAEKAAPAGPPDVPDSMAPRFAPVANGPCGGCGPGRGPRGLDVVGAAGTGWRGMVGAARTVWPDLVGAASTGFDDPGNGNRARSSGSGTRSSGT